MGFWPATKDINDTILDLDFLANNFVNRLVIIITQDNAIDEGHLPANLHSNTLVIKMPGKMLLRERITMGKMERQLNFRSDVQIP